MIALILFDTAALIIYVLAMCMHYETKQIEKLLK